MPTTIVDILRKRVVERYRDYRERIAVSAAVDARDVDKLLDASDENVVRALMNLMKMGGSNKLVETSMFQNIRSLFNVALGAKRHYAIGAPPGIGKTFAVTYLRDQFNEDAEADSVQNVPIVAYLYTSEFGNRKTTIMSDVAEAFRFSTTEGGLGGRRQYKQLVNYFAERDGHLLVIDEAQRLDYGALEAMRCLMDQTRLSFLFVGSDEFKRKMDRRADAQQYGQFLRRVEWGVSVQHATTNDVKLFLSTYGIESTKKEAALIAKRIHNMGELSTLYNALSILGRATKNDDVSWKGMGAGRVLEAVEMIINLQRPRAGEQIAEAA